MVAQGVLVFDEEEALATGGEIRRSFISLDDQVDVLVFDVPPTREVSLEDPDTDFLVFDVQPVLTETVEAPPDFLLIDPAKEPTRVILETTGEDLLVISPGGPAGPTGAPGTTGPQGPPGQDGPGAYFQEFNFASPATTWTVVHNRNSVALNVETLDTNGDPIEGYVRFVDVNTIEIDWYYPTAGTVRLFR